MPGSRARSRSFSAIREFEGFETVLSETNPHRPRQAAE